MSIAILVGGVVFALWLMRKMEADRQAKELRDAARTELDESLESGLAPGDHALDGLALTILDDWPAHNSNYVDRTFRDAYWQAFPSGGMAGAFEAGMNAARWKAGSRKEVYDRLKNYGVISEAEKDRLRALADAMWSQGFGPGAVRLQTTSGRATAIAGRVRA